MGWVPVLTPYSGFSTQPGGHGQVLKTSRLVRRAPLGWVWGEQRLFLPLFTKNKSLWVVNEAQRPGT